MPTLWQKVRRAVASDIGGAEPAQQAARPRVSGFPERRRVHLDGQVTAVFERTTPGGASSYVARLEGAHGVVELVWLGRPPVVGLATGSSLRVRGLLTTVRGRATVFNPDYELLAHEDVS